WCTAGFERYRSVMLALGAQPMGSLGLCVLLLLVAPGQLAARGSAPRLFPGFADDDCPSTSEAASSTLPVYRLLRQEAPISPGVTAPDSWMQRCPTHRLLADHPSESEPFIAASDLMIDAAPRFDQAETEVPRWEFLKRHRPIISAWSASRSV